MGLDGVELVLDLEDRFGIVIPNAHAERIRTAGELYVYVLGRVQRFTSGTCRSAMVYYRLRTALVKTFEISRKQVQLNAPLRELLSRTTPHQAWQQLQEQLEFKLPALRYPSWFLPLSIAMVFGPAVAMLPWSVHAACILPMISLILVSFLIRFADRSSYVPNSYSTVRGLVHAVVAKIPVGADIEPSAVWDSVRELIADTCGVPAERVTSESRLHEDLGLA